MNTGGTDARSHTDEGVSLEDLVNVAAPTLPSAKNALLRSH